MKNIIYVFLLFSSFCQAQDYTHPRVRKPVAAIKKNYDTVKRELFFVSLNAGISVPFQDYDATNRVLLSNEVQGFAITGFQINITGGIFLSTPLAFIAKAGVDFNSVDQAEFRAENGGQATRDFKIQQYMGGLCYRVALKPTFFFGVQVMAGYISINYPSFTSIVYNVPYYHSLPEEGVPGYSFGAGIEKMITGYMGLVAHISYSSATVTYTSSTLATSGFTATQYTPVFMNYGSMAITAGVSFHL